MRLKGYALRSPRERPSCDKISVDLNLLGIQNRLHHYTRSFVSHENDVDQDTDSLICNEKCSHPVDWTTGISMAGTFSPCRRTNVGSQITIRRLLD